MSEPIDYAALKAKWITQITREEIRALIAKAEEADELRALLIDAADRLESLNDLVSAEREACAKLAENSRKDQRDHNDLAAAIRSRT